MTMILFPKKALKKLYNHTSLKHEGDGVSFSVKNRLSPASVVEVSHLAINGRDIPHERVTIAYNKEPPILLSQVTADHPVNFSLGDMLTFHLAGEKLTAGEHKIELDFLTRPFGQLQLAVSDSLNTGKHASGALPRDITDDYSRDIIKARQVFIEEHTACHLQHIRNYSIDPQLTRGNIEHFTGVAQVPMGFAGPLLVNGQHARGEFYVPLSTTEGTLVASYNRGMKVLHLSGGIKCAVVDDKMQRAPVFVFEDAMRARQFTDWLDEHAVEIKAVADATDPFIHLKHVDYYLASKFAYLRFNYQTGDAAGMNMVGKATLAACNWILQNCDVAETQRFFLEANFATDKKASMINMMRTRGKRVTAEAVVKRDALIEVMDAEPTSLYQHYKVATIGSILSGANNNGCHAANAIAAIFIATGQDAANVSESSTGLVFCELTEEQDLYISITLPSLIVATCGGGTGLPTQKEALEAIGCYGAGKVYKFAEIVAATVLAGEVSLAAAISSLDWVSSHEQLGRNDPRAR
jgi:hydroxymethylglutaryl-CoA reductase (NADPH)